MESSPEHKGVRVTVDAPPTKNKQNLKKPVQPNDQDIWSNFRSFFGKTTSVFLFNLKTACFSQKPSLGTILNESGVEFCSSYVVSNLTLTYSKAQT